jgi:hypothetical protein
VQSDKDAFLNDLIQQTDLVVGMFSSILIEAELLGKKAIGILSGFKKGIIFQQTATSPITDKEKLLLQIKTI